MVIDNVTPVPWGIGRLFELSSRETPYIAILSVGIGYLSFRVLYLKSEVYRLTELKFPTLKAEGLK